MSYNSKYTGAEVEALLDRVGNYPLVSHGTADTTFELTPNTMHVWAEVSALTLTLGTEESGKVNEYIFQFTSGVTATTLSLPSSIVWGNEEPLIPEAGKTYQVSIVNNIATYTFTVEYYGIHLRTLKAKGSQISLAFTDIPISVTGATEVSRSTSSGITTIVYQTTSQNICIAPTISYLDCAGQSVENIDFYEATTLATLYVGNNLITKFAPSSEKIANLSSLNLSNNPVTEIALTNGVLSDLTASSCTHLHTLDVHGNALTEIDFTGLDALEKVDVSENNLTGANVNSNTNLEQLNCSNNPNLKNLGTNGLTNLKKLNISYCNFSTVSVPLDFTSNTALVSLACNNSSIKGIKVGGLTNLQNLYAQNNGMTTLSINNTCTALKNLNLSGNSYPGLTFDGYAALEDLNVSNSAALTSLTVKNNPVLTTLNHENCPNLVTLTIENNTALAAINASNNTSLVTLNLDNAGGNISELNLNGCVALDALMFRGNKIQTMSIEGCVALRNFVGPQNLFNTAEILDAMIAALPDRTGLTQIGYFRTYDKDVTETNIEVNEAQKAALIAKRWRANYRQGTGWHSY